MIRSLLAAAVAALLLGIPGGLVRAADPVLTTVRIATIGQDANAEAFFAEEIGIFKKYGIHAELNVIRRGGGAAVAAAVAGGAAEIGEGDIISVAAAREHGIPIQLIAPSALYRSSAPTTEIVVAKNAALASAKDLEGKSIALISLEGPSRIATNAWLEANGATLDKVAFVELPPINMGAAVERGTVAAAVVNEPTLTATQSCCRVFGNNFAALGNQWLITGWYATADWLQKNPDLARRLVLALRETAQWANQPANHQRSGEILDKYTPFPPELLARMTRATYGETFSLATIQPVLDAALKYKALKEPVAARTLLAPGVTAQ